MVTAGTAGGSVEGVSQSPAGGTCHERPGLSYRGPPLPEGDEVLSTEQFLGALDAMPRHERVRVLKQVEYLLQDRYQAAKGIEFPVVFVAGVTREILPRLEAIRLWDEDENRVLEMERQRTLLYVGMTRAAQRLFRVTVAGKESPFRHEFEDFSLVKPYPPGGSAR